MIPNLEYQNRITCSAFALVFVFVTLTNRKKSNRARHTYINRNAVREIVKPILKRLKVVRQQRYVVPSPLQLLQRADVRRVKLAVEVTLGAGRSDEFTLEVARNDERSANESYDIETMIYDGLISGARQRNGGKQRQSAMQMTLTLHECENEHRR